MAAPHPLQRKRSKGYVPRIVAGSIDSSSEKEKKLLCEMRKVRDSTYHMSHRFFDIGSCFPHSQAESPYGGGDCAADGQGDTVTAEQVAQHDTCH
jgi:hypothetical protein